MLMKFMLIRMFIALALVADALDTSPTVFNLSLALYSLDMAHSPTWR